MSDSTKFDYLLNVFETAVQDVWGGCTGPDVRYAAKREALLAYVHDLKQRALQPAPSAQAPTDDVLEALDLDPASFRTEGGAINRGKLCAAILHPDEYLPADHWLRATPPAPAQSAPSGEIAPRVLARIRTMLTEAGLWKPGDSTVEAVRALIDRQSSARDCK